MASNPASSFFYIFTAAHGVHLLGGVGALLYVLVRKFDNTRMRCLRLRKSLLLLAFQGWTLGFPVRYSI